MKDRFEEFIETHRDEFDMHEPPASVWNGLHRKLNPKKNNSHTGYAAAAASILFIAGAFIWFNQASKNTKNNPAAIETVLSPDMKEAEAYYTGLTNEKQDELKKYKTQYPELCGEFAREIDTLNAGYRELKTEYASSLSKEVVKQAMIENLQTKVQIIDQQLQILKEVIEKNRNGFSS